MPFRRTAAASAISITSSTTVVVSKAIPGFNTTGTAPPPGTGTGCSPSRSQVAGPPSTIPGQGLFRYDLVYPGASSYWPAFWTAATVGLPWRHPAASSYWLAFWTATTLCNFFSFVSTHFGTTIEAVQCNNGEEFDNLVHACSSSPVASISTCHVRKPPPRMVKPSTSSVPQITLFALSCSGQYSPSYWVEALHIMTYRLNILPTKTLDFSTSHLSRAPGDRVAGPQLRSS